MDDDFYTAFLEGENRLGFQTLKPLSLWHNFLLSAINHPIINDGKIEIHDLITAIQVFKCEYPNKPDLRKTWLRQIQLWFLKLSPKRLRFIDSYLRDYIVANGASPYLLKAESKAKPLTAPPFLQTVISLISFGWSEKDAWNMPIGKAKWYEASFLERESDSISFVYKSERERIENMGERSEKELLEKAIETMGEERALHWFQQRKINNG